MDIHDPKPWRGVREFLKEYAIIVVGVLTALGAEQAVEALHWRHEAAAAREALKPEYLRLVEMAGSRDGQSPCIARRLDELQAVLETAAATGRLPPLGPPERPSREPWRLRVWDSVVSGQVLPHMARKEVLFATGVAVSTEYMGRIRDAEMDHWAQLETLMGPGRKIESNEISAYRRDLGVAAREANFMRVNSDQLGRQIVSSGLVTRAEAAAAWRNGLENGRNWRICKPMGTVPVALSALQPDLTRPPAEPF
jgi:hypothetical protein